MVPPSEKPNFTVKIQEKMTMTSENLTKNFFENCNTILV